MSPVVVLSTARCPQCTATVKAFKRIGADLTVVDVNADDAAREIALALGHRQLPVVIAAGAHWSGFRPDLIQEHIAGPHAAAPAARVITHRKPA